MDIALEALVVETVTVSRRAAVTTAKLCGASLGGMIGTGVLTICYARLGWRASLLIVAGLDTLCLIPILIYPEDILRLTGMPVRPERDGSRHNHRLAKRVAIVGLYFAASALLLN